ncbi:MAG: twin-arginine translocation signal domain-containing protein [Actinomycetota bacterium]|nr:twin-arginine translocation signal domain-containing protein [Actinomycetota bacterium]
MRFDFAQHHLMHRGITPAEPDLGRREAMKKLGAAGAAMAVAGTVGSSAVSAGQQSSSHNHSHGHGSGNYGPNQYSDDMFDIANAMAGGWAPGPYGPLDQRGSLNEVTPERMAKAMRKLNLGKPVKSYQLG